MNFGGTVRVNKCAILIIVGVLFLLFLYNYTGKEDDIIKSQQSPQKVDSDVNIISLKSILNAAIDLAERGGLEVVQVRTGPGGTNLAEQTKGKTKEGANDPVTQGDFRSHRVMYYGMRKAFPNIKVISEEHTDNKDEGDISSPNLVNQETSRILFTDEMFEPQDVAVWIDPLDATQEYTENLVEFVTTMVCVTVRGVPIIGVIHKPFSKETFWSAVGHGNSANLEDLRKRSSPHRGTKDKFHIIVSRSHTGKAENFTSHILQNGEDFDIIQAAGAGYKVLEVIGGKADAYLHVTLIKKWDLCAGNAILSSLGGTMSTLSGEPLNYSFDTDPVNTQGVLAYLHPSPIVVDKLKQIRLTE